MMSRKSQPDGIKELALSLSQAQTLRSVADTVERFCGKTFGSPTGMIFVEREGNLELIRAWRSRQVSIKHLQRYLNEFGYRFNRREDADLFEQTVGRMCAGKALPYAKLVEENAFTPFVRHS